MSELTDLIAKRFIARRDVKARQFSDGSGYSPVRSPWTRVDIEDHLAGRRTYGHYLLNQNDQCKLFAFDIDLTEKGFYPWPYDYTAWNDKNQFTGEIREFNPQEAWKDRAHPARGWMKRQMKTLAAQLCRGIKEELTLPCAVAYSGNKGLHVYGFMGSALSASDCREGGKIVLDSLGEFKLEHGQNFFASRNKDPIDGFPNFLIEIFPKQDTLTIDKPLGNLMRLPLGKNLKNPKDPTFFVDMTVELTELTSTDPIKGLTANNPFEPPGDS